MVARGVGRELAASVAAHRDILYRIQHPCGMIIPCFFPVVNTFFCGFGGSRNFRDIVTKTTGYSGVVWLKGRPGGTVARGEPRARRGAGGGLPPCGTGYPCPGGEDHLKRRRRLRRIVPSPPVPPLLGCRHCPKESISTVFAPSRRLPFAGCLYGRSCKCRKRFSAGVPGAKPPAK